MKRAIIKDFKPTVMTIYGEFSRNKFGTSDTANKIKIIIV